MTAYMFSSGVPAGNQASTDESCGAMKSTVWPTASREQKGFHNYPGCVFLKVVYSAGGAKPPPLWLHPLSGLLMDTNIS